MKIIPKLKLSATSQSLIALTLLCFSLTATRLITQGASRYTFLVFNLFLAWMPYFFIHAANKLKHLNKNLIYPFYLLWFLFFPNAPYIITDLLHLQHYTQKILWFDSLLIFVYALTGILLGAHSLLFAHQIFIHRFGKFWAGSIVAVVLFLSGFGIYLGRYCRLNSWDMFHSPFWFYGRVLHQFNNPLAYKVTLTYAFVMSVLYVIFLRYHKPEKLS